MQQLLRDIWFGAIVGKGACTVISRQFPRSVDVVAWPVQRRFAFCTSWKVSEVISPQPKTTVQKSPKKIYHRYTFAKSAQKIDGRVLVLSPHVKACDFLGLIEYLFSETLHNNLPVARAKQLGRSLTKTTSCKKATELPGQTSSLIGQKNIFLPNQRDGIRPLLELVR